MSTYEGYSQKKSNYVALVELEEKLRAIDKTASNQAAGPDR